MPHRDDTELFEHMKQYVALIGRGQKSGKTLSQEQARHLMGKLLNNDALPEQVGAVLMLLRMREETDEELAGFLQACRESCKLQLDPAVTIAYDFGCYAGKRRHLPWLLLAAMTLAETGEKVFLHGLAESDSQRLYLDEVFAALGWVMPASSAHANDLLEHYGFCYMSISHFHPAMKSLLQKRHILGLRSCMHSLSKMLNPAKAECSIHGIFHRDLDTQHIDVGARVGDDSVVCIRGDSGEVEVAPEKPFVMHSVENRAKTRRHFPALLTRCARQTRQLGVVALKELWTGATECEYGQQAIIGTLAVALCCKNHLSVEQGLSQATALWQGRSGNWPDIKLS